MSRRYAPARPRRRIPVTCARLDFGFERLAGFLVLERGFLTRQVQWSFAAVFAAGLHTFRRPGYFRGGGAGACELPLELDQRVFAAIGKEIL